MRKFFDVTLLAALALLVCFTAAGQQLIGSASPDWVGWSGGASNNVSALPWLVVPASGGTPTVTFIAYGSDLANAKITAYKVDAQTTENYTNTTVSLPVTQTNTFGNSDVVIIRHLANDWYEKRITTTFTSATNLTLTVAPVQAVLPGDVIYHCSTTGAATFNVGATTNSVNGVGLFYGQRGFPLLLDLNGTSAASLYSVSATWTLR